MVAETHVVGLVGNPGVFNTKPLISKTNSLMNPVMSKLHTEVVPAQHNTRHKQTLDRQMKRWKKRDQDKAKGMDA